MFASRASRALSGSRSLHTVVFMRHGQSTWNLENRFTGWVDCPLTPLGVSEAVRAGEALAAEKFEFDVAYTSVLQRAIKTCWTVLDVTQQHFVPVLQDWRLNERHYGALQGLNKAETTAKHGEEKVTLWRRSYDVPPPAYDSKHPFYVGGERRYAGLDISKLPATESTKTCSERVVPFWLSTLQPLVKQGKRLIVVAHGNSLRALIKHIDGISDEAIVGLNVPTGVPLVYQFDEATFKPVPQKGRMDGLSGRYVGDLDAIAAEIAKVKNRECPALGAQPPLRIVSRASHPPPYHTTHTHLHSRAEAKAAKK
jgi:2,3-bisphosphoglycerate-dependent phosphoglycerate mutase